MVKGNMIINAYYGTKTAGKKGFDDKNYFTVMNTADSTGDDDKIFFRSEKEYTQWEANGRESLKEKIRRDAKQREAEEMRMNGYYDYSIAGGDDPEYWTSACDHLAPVEEEQPTNYYGALEDEEDEDLDRQLEYGCEQQMGQEDVMSMIERFAEARKRGVPSSLLVPSQFCGDWGDESDDDDFDW